MEENSLHISNIKREIIKVEVPIAWKPGKNKNNWELLEADIKQSINEAIKNTECNVPVCNSNDAVRNLAIDMDNIVGWISEFNPDNMSCIINLYEGDYNMPVEDTVLGFNYTADLDDDKIVRNVKVRAGVLLKKGTTCYCE